MNEQRYYTQCGSNPEVSGAFHMSGPQAADQILLPVRELLDRSGITQVVVLFDGIK